MCAIYALARHHRVITHPKSTAQLAPMLTLKNLISPTRVVRYFGQELEPDASSILEATKPGIWAGEGCAKLALKGKVTKKALAKVLDAIDPNTDLPLRQRKPRKCCTDICYSPPKSVSVMAMVDSRIQALIEDTVQSAIPEIAARTRVRDRAEGRSQDEVTRPCPTIVCAIFPHLSSRENDPDPHGHIILANRCFDSARKKWMAVDNRQIFRDRRFLDLYLHNRLAAGLKRLGYELTPSDTSFEVAGVPPQLCSRFSKRRAQIMKTLAGLDKEIRLLRSHRSLTAKEAARLKYLEGLGAFGRNQLANFLSRAEKSDRSKASSRRLFESQVTEGERALLGGLLTAAVRRSGKSTRPGQSSSIDPAHLQAALESAFEETWIRTEFEIIAQGLRQNLGRYDVPSWKRDLANTTLVRINADTLVEHSTANALKELSGYVSTRYPPAMLAKLGGEPQNRKLSSSVLHKALASFLSTDRCVTAFRSGNAKTNLRFVEAVSQLGDVALLSATLPTAPPRYVRGEEARRRMTRKELTQECEKIENHRVIVVQHANASHPRDLNILLKAALEHGVKVLLLDQGGRKSNQRNFVRYLEQYTGLHVSSAAPGSLTAKRHKQILARFSHVDSAAEAVAEIRAWNGVLEAAEPGPRHELIASSFVSSLAQGRTAVVITGAEAEASAITHAIRARLRTQDEPHGDPQITGPDRPVVTLTRLNLDSNQRRQGSSYQVGQTIEFDQNVPGIARGQQFDVIAADHGAVLIGRGDEKSTLNLEWADKLTVYEKHYVKMAIGDKVIATRNRMARKTGNRKARKGGRLVKNHAYTVTKISPEGQVELDGEVAFPSGHAHVRLGYAFNAATDAEFPRVHDVHIALSARAMGKIAGWPAFRKFMDAAKENVLVYTDNADSFAKMLVDTAPLKPSKQPKSPRLTAIAPTITGETMEEHSTGNKEPTAAKQSKGALNKSRKPIPIPHPTKRPPALEH